MEQNGALQLVWPLNVFIYVVTFKMMSLLDLKPVQTIAVTWLRICTLLALFASREVHSKTC